MTKWNVIATGSALALALSGCPPLEQDAVLLQDSFQSDCGRAACDWLSTGTVEAVEGFHSAERAVRIAPGARIERTIHFVANSASYQEGLVLGMMVACRRGGVVEATLDNEVQRLGPYVVGAPETASGDDWAWSEVDISPESWDVAEAGDAWEYTVGLHNPGDAPCAIDDVLVVARDPW